MAAILPFLEHQDDPAETPIQRRSLMAPRRGPLRLDMIERLQGLGKMPDADVLDVGELTAEAINQSHAELIGTAWIRKTVEDSLVGRTYKVQARDRKGARPKDVFIILDGPIVLPDEVVSAWNPPAIPNAQSFSVLSWTSKMGTPSFSLPAGPPTAGGSCPGALAGQTIVPVHALRGAARRVQEITGRPVKVQDAICQRCLAGDTLVTVRDRGVVRLDSLPTDSEFEVWSGIAWRTTRLIEQGMRYTAQLMTNVQEQTLHLTEDHKILTRDHGMVEARHLQDGQALMTGSVGEPLRQGPTFRRLDLVGPPRRVFDLLNVGDERHFIANGIGASNCYAEGGQYSTSQVQFAQILRYVWTREAAKDVTFEYGRIKFGPKAEAWIKAMHYAIANADFMLDGGKVDKMVYPPERRDGRFFRWHDSGDFFSKSYLAMVKAVCNALPDITFWAPSRIWATEWGQDAVNAINGPAESSNLVIRPSAYHINEAPVPRQKLGRGWAAGSSAFAVDRDGRDPLTGAKAFDWDCQTYSVTDESHTCRHAKAPDGKVGCRACWVKPELVIDYRVH